MKRIQALCLLIVLFLSSSALAAKEDVYINLDQVDVRTVAQLIAQKLHKNVIIDENVRGKVTVISQNPVTPEVAWEMVANALRVIGATVYDEGEYIKIVPRSQIKEVVPPVGKALPREMAGAAPFVLIYNFERLDASKVVRVIRPLLSSQAIVLNLPGTGIIIIRDLAENLGRIGSLLKMIETQGAFPEIKVFHLRYASAHAVRSQIAPLIKALGHQREIVSDVIQDERTNSLIVLGDQAIFRDVEKLIQDLDIKVEAKGKRFDVIKLKYASAEDLAEVLKTLEIGHVSIEGQKDSETADAFPEDGIKVAAEKSSNSLIVYATPWEYQTVRDLIKKLDVRKKQILLATTVVEVSLSRLKSLGVQWQILGNEGAGAFGGGLSSTDLYSAVASGNLVMGAFSQNGKNVTMGTSTVFFPDLLFLFSLLHQDSSFNLVSNPKILTLDNKKAKINVGQSVPYTTGITFQANTIPMVSFEYKDVGLELTILPHIVGNTVKLEITQNMQDVTDILRAQQGNVDFVAPVTSKREISSQVIVDNGQTVILGGLVSRKLMADTSKVPGIGDMPVIGGLFRKKSSTQEKTSLFVFITPYIISSPEELRRITEEHQALSGELKTLMQFSRLKEKTE